jgi:hypothetical protein
MTLREQIAAIDDLPSKVVVVEKWGGAKLLLRALSGDDFVWFVKQTMSGQADGARMFDFGLTSASELIQRGAWDPDNPATRVFAREDIAGILDKKSFEVRQELALEIIQLTIPSSAEVGQEKKDSSAMGSGVSGTT